LERILLRELYYAQLDDFNRLSYVREVSQEDLDQLRNDSLLVSDSVHERWMREEWSNINISTALPDLRIPVLFVNGMKDVVINPEDQHADAMSIPNAKEVIFANEGHMFPMEAPEKCAGEIAHFFGSLGSFSETRL
jgi:pimeloyl-ACP methyl ester carboxylesterase